MQICYRGFWIEVVKAEHGPFGWTAVALAGRFSEPACLAASVDGFYSSEFEAVTFAIKKAKRQIADYLLDVVIEASTNGGVSPSVPAMH